MQEKVRLGAGVVIALFGILRLYIQIPKRAEAGGWPVLGIVSGGLLLVAGVWIIIRESRKLSKRP
jgi:hypothetical protein